MEELKLPPGLLERQIASTRAEVAEWPAAWQSSTTTNNNTTAGATLESMLETMAEFERRFPKSQMATAICCGYQVLAELTRKIKASPVDARRSMADLPTIIDESLGYPAYVIEYADGTEEVIPGCGLEPIRRKTKRAA